MTLSPEYGDPNATTVAALQEAETAIAALAKRFWSIHPKEIQDLGITREQFYEREMRALFVALISRSTAVDASERNNQNLEDCIMPLYDCGAEDCEECQIAFRGVKAQGPITCDEIVALIREKYDPVPSDWPHHRCWDDGAKEIADAILSRRVAS